MKFNEQKARKILLALTKCSTFALENKQVVILYSELDNKMYNI